MSKQDEQETIEIDPLHPHLILCEGKDVYNFIVNFLDETEKIYKDFFNFYVYDFKGIKQLTKYILNFIKQDSFDIVKSITIIRDAERDAIAACSSIKESLRKAGLSVPQTPCTPVKDINSDFPDIATGFVLFPTCSNEIANGTLEDLCLNILDREDSSSILHDIDKALEPYKSNLSRIHKNRLHAFFSFTNEYVSLKIGEAARCKAFSYDGPEMTSLKKFLVEILEK